MQGSGTLAYCELLHPTPNPHRAQFVYQLETGAEIEAVPSDIFAMAHDPSKAISTLMGKPGIAPESFFTPSLLVWRYPMIGPNRRL